MVMSKLLSCFSSFSTSLWHLFNWAMWILSTLSTRPISVSSLSYKGLKALQIVSLIANILASNSSFYLDSSKTKLLSVYCSSDSTSNFYEEKEDIQSRAFNSSRLSSIPLDLDLVRLSKELLLKFLGRFPASSEVWTNLSFFFTVFDSPISGLWLEFFALSEFELTIWLNGCY